VSKSGDAAKRSRALEIRRAQKDTALPVLLNSKTASGRERGIQVAANWLRENGHTDLAEKMVREVPRKSGEPIDLTGRVIGRLTVIRMVGSRPRMWLCMCECGTEKTIKSSHLLNGSVNSCGCWRAERIRTSNTTHGMTQTRTWRIWNGMLRRCDGRTSPEQRAVYFDRGIRCCERWRVFENFLADLGKCPSDLHTLEREDVNGNYEPENCRWATYPEQARNRRNSRKITLDGETLIVTDWAKRSGVPAATIFARLYMGWPERKSVETPVRGAIQ